MVQYCDSDLVVFRTVLTQHTPQKVDFSCDNSGKTSMDCSMFSLQSCTCWFILTPLLFLFLFALIYRFLHLFVSWGVVTLFIFVPWGDAAVRDVYLCAVPRTVLYVWVFRRSRLGLSGCGLFFWIWFVLFYVCWNSGFLLIDLFRLLCFVVLSGVFGGLSFALLSVAAWGAGAWTRLYVLCARKMDSFILNIL